MNAVKILFLHLAINRFLLFVSFVASFDQRKCPLEWTPVAEHCVRLYPRSVDAQAAQSICDDNLAQLLNILVDDTLYTDLIADVYELLQHYFEIGLHELAWLVAAGEWTPSSGINYDVWSKTQSVQSHFAIIQRTSSRKYKLSTFSTGSTYPFICSLRPQFKRLLLYQQAILPTGVPRITEQPSSEYLYTDRSDNNYITLPCTAVGKPLPHIKWFRNGVEEIDVGTENSSLLLAGGSLMIAVGSRDGSDESAYASYHCTAENQLGVVRSVSAIVRPAFISAFHSSRMDVFAFIAPGRGARIECQAPLHYPKSLSYSWMMDGSTERFVSQTERIFISHDGTLYFAYNVKEDATSYACSLALSSTQSGNYGPFFHLKLPPKLSELTFEPLIDEMQPQIFPEYPLLGHTTYLECFAYGRPSPSYRWTRIDGRPISSKAKATNYGRVLKIDSLEPEDSGTYKCIAENEHGADTAEVTLLVQALPAILWPLQDRIVASNATTVFDCHLAAADGNIEWFRDAVPISPLLMSSDDRARFLIEDNKLIINRIRPEDNGIYECIANNEIGSTSSSARLTVVDFMPRFDGNAMPKRVFAVVGSELTIPCIYHSSPPGSATWSRYNGERLSSNGRIRAGNDRLNALVIHPVQSDDHGEYICTAINVYGEAQFSVYVVVIEKPNVVVQPPSESLSAQSGSVNISCEVEMFCENLSDCPEALFEWTVNDRPIRSLPQYQKVHTRASESYEPNRGQPSSKVKQKLELELSPTLGLHRLGRFACTSLFGGGASEFEPSYIPPSPIDLQVINVSSQTVNLSWKQPSTRHRDRKHGQIAVDAYMIDFRTKLDRTWKPVPNTLISTKDSIIVSYTVANLEPFLYYQFRVMARASNRISRPSRSTEWLRTLPSPPRQIIGHTSWRRLNGEYIVIEWEPLEKEHYGGPNLRYEISWNDGTKESPQKQAVVHESAYMVRLAAAGGGCRRVSFSIRAVNDIGKGPPSDDMIVHLSGEAPTRKAIHLFATVVNSTCATIQWEWTSTTECENLHGVELSCKPWLNASDGANVKYSIPLGLPRWVTCGLQPSTEYACEVTAFDNYARRGEASEPVHFLTKPSPPLQAPEITKWWLQKRGSGYSMYLEWSPVKLRQMPSNVSNDAGYNVRVHVSETASRPLTLKVSESELQTLRNPMARIDELKLMYYYTLRISAYNEGGEGPSSEPRSLRIGLSYRDFLSSASIRRISVLLLIVPLLCC
uniref:Contactin n=1 Tax=Ascaris suum TaxID=6253 RepID=F1KSD8_ASCSU